MSIKGIKISLVSKLHQLLKNAMITINKIKPLIRSRETCKALDTFGEVYTFTLIF